MTPKRGPFLIALGVIAFVCLLRLIQPEFLERLEWITFDMRARFARHFPAPCATNLGFVSIDERSLIRVRDGTLGFRFGLYWPRQVYGRLLEELSAQGVKAVALDVLFGELRPDHPPVILKDNTSLESDEFFAAQLHRSGNSILAITRDLTPPAIFLTNAAALGDISTDKDSDGVLRRVCAFRTYRDWHPAFLQVESNPDYGVELDRALVEASQIVLRRTGEDDIKVPLDANGTFSLADFWGDNLPEGMPRRAKPFVEKRVWHMGIVLAARQLGLNLEEAEVDLSRGRIVLHGAGGITRALNVDKTGYFYIDWIMPPNHSALLQQNIEELLLQDRARLQGQTNDLKSPWAGKLAIVGSSALANDLTDRGATPLFSDTLLVSKHWNVANSILTGRFVTRSPTVIDLLLISVLGALAALATWRMRALTGFSAVVFLGITYVAVCFAVYAQTRYWLPVVVPVFGALLMTHLCLLTWRVIFEQTERRRVKTVFSKMVSPKIVNELLAAERLSLGGARREITVFFADVRGFTEMTDSTQEVVAEKVRRGALKGAAAEACFEEQAREILATVNLYLGLIADIIRKQDGTLDKFIGDCVMAFWGAPVGNPGHAVCCVRAAIEAQRAIYELNRERLAENERREVENFTRIGEGKEVLPMLPILFLGTGINTGTATAGLMGSSQSESMNYTVFGREVNLASRLETASGRGRIYIGEATYQHLLRDDPELAKGCTALPPMHLKGFLMPVQAYELRWLPPGSPPLEELFPAAVTRDPSAVTGFFQRTTG